MKKVLFIVLATTILGWVSPMKAEDAKGVEIKTYTYAIKGKDTLRVDVYLREDMQNAENLPMMLYVHGGGFSMGSRKNAAQEIFLRHFAEKGFLDASIDYRLGAVEGNPYHCNGTAEVIRLATTDMAEATRYLMDNFKIDPAKIITSGGSAGAYTVLGIEYDICNGEEYVRQILPEGFNYAGIISAAGAICTTDGKSPTWPKKPCPIMLMQGDKDVVVPMDSVDMLGLKMFGTMALHRQFSKLGFPHWVYIEKGADHVVAMKHLTDNLEEADKFYRSFIVDRKGSTVVMEWEDPEPAGMKDVNEMIKFVPMYILGYDKYLNEIDFNNMEKPTGVVY